MIVDRLPDTMGFCTGLRVVGIDRRAKRKNDMDFSKSTVQSDISEDSCTEGAFDHEGRQLLKSCLKVPTQRESLAKIERSRVKNTSAHHHYLRDLRPVSEESCVRFDTVEFRQYAQILSDNPSTSAGPPIGIGWEFFPEDTIKLDVDVYERGCEDLRLRRSRDELIIPRDLRETILREVGYSRHDIVNAIRGVQKDKVRRNVSFHRQKYEPIAERVETLKYCVRRLSS